MTGLHTWLTGVLDAEEKTAQRASRFRWDHPTDAPWEQARIIAERVGTFTVMRFTALHTPARALATIAAHRRILERHAPDDRFSFLGALCTWCSPGEAQQTLPCPDLRDLASIYADREGYDPAWGADLDST